MCHYIGSLAEPLASYGERNEVPSIHHIIHVCFPYSTISLSHYYVIYHIHPSLVQNVMRCKHIHNKYHTGPALTSAFLCCIHSWQLSLVMLHTSSQKSPFSKLLYGFCSKKINLESKRFCSPLPVYGPPASSPSCSCHWSGPPCYRGALAPLPHISSPGRH